MDRNERIAINQRADPSAPRRPIWDFNLPKTILKSGAAQNAFAAVGLINGLAWRRQTGPASLVLWRRRRRSLRSESIRFAAPRAARASAAVAAAAELR